MTNAGSIRVTSDGSERTVHLSTDHLTSTKTARQVGQKVTAGLADSDQDRVNIDLQDVERIGSAGLNQLISINSKCRSLGVKVVLMDAQDSVKNVFSLTRLERMFEVR